MGGGCVVGVGGVVPLVASTVARDLAQYLLESEQKPSAVALGVYLAPGGRVEAAGGYLVQALPGAPESALVQVERRVGELVHPSELVRAGLSQAAVKNLPDTCTCCQPERFHSFRRDGARAGRLTHWISTGSPPG